MELQPWNTSSNKTSTVKDYSVGRNEWVITHDFLKDEEDPDVLEKFFGTP
jgi:hypothetical protein